MILTIVNNYYGGGEYISQTRAVFIVVMFFPYNKPLICIPLI